MKKIFLAVFLLSMVALGTNVYAGCHGGRNNGCGNYYQYNATGTCRNLENCPYDGDCPNNYQRPLDGTGYKHGNCIF